MPRTHYADQTIGPRTDRRNFLQTSLLGAMGLASPALSFGAGTSTGKAKACILIHQVGAPSQIDTWDPKPEAPREIRGPFSTIRTNAPEIRLTELFPRMARIADKFSLIRSVHQEELSTHEMGTYVMERGRLQSGDAADYPHIGNVVSSLLSTGHTTSRLSAGHFILTGKLDKQGAPVPRPLDSSHQAFTAYGDPSREALWTAPIGQAVAWKEEIRHLKDAPGTRDAFDLSQEPDSIRAAYGMNRFGQCCLLARRLIERGATFITLPTALSLFDEPTWDIHGTKPFSTLADLRDSVAPIFDRAYSALITDLHQRGLLSSTLVCNLAEFGRSPIMNRVGGRDHWSRVWTVALAGGGVQGGRVIGKSDAHGAEPAQRPVTPAEITATIYHALGVKAHCTVPDALGISRPILAADTHPVRELF